MQSLKRNLLNFFNRVGLLYLLAAGFIFLVGTPQQAWRHAVPNTLSRYIPDYDDLSRFYKDHTALPNEKWEEFERYFKKVSDLMPSLPDAPAMQGFSLYYLGKYPQAKKALELAIERYPYGTHFYYNLGIVHLRLGQPQKAIELFRKTLTLDPKRNIEFIIGSHIYTPLLPYPGNDLENARVLTRQVPEHYEQSSLQILHCQHVLKDYESMLYFADLCIRQKFEKAGPFYFYAGWAAYQLKDYAKAVYYLQEAIKLKFQYAECYEALGGSLRAMGRPESQAVLLAYASLAQSQKFYFSIAPHLELILF